MKKYWIFVLLFIISCGGTQNSSIQDTATTIIQDTSTTTIAPTTTTTTSSTTTTTTIPVEELENKCFIYSDVGITLPKLIEFKYLSSFTVSDQETISFSYKIQEGHLKLARIAINYSNLNLNRNDYGEVVQDYRNGLPSEGIITTDISSSSMQSGMSYNIWSIQINDEKYNQVEYIGHPGNPNRAGQIWNNITGDYCELKHSFFGKETIFEIQK